MSLKVLNMNPRKWSFSFPLLRLPLIGRQRRKRQAKNSMPERKMMGADTETIEGRVWLFSTEKGVWEIESFADLMRVIYSRPHLSKWKKTKASGRGTKYRGFSPMEFFFYNLKFDSQAIFKTLADEVVLTLIDSSTYEREGELGNNKVTVNADTGDFGPDIKGRMVELDYIEGKSLVIRPIDWVLRSPAGTDFHLGTCYCWDIAQFYGKLKLQQASEDYLGSSKIEVMFDGTELDASRFDDPEYRDLYREDIEKYALQDAVLTGELARLKRSDFIQSGVRFIRPYSLANVAQRSALDTCKIPTINAYSKDEQLRQILVWAHSSFLGGWFETSGAGYRPDVQAVDLASAYPYVMWHLPDISEGVWYFRKGKESLLEWLAQREPMSLGFIEASFLFDTTEEWNPLCVKNDSGALVAPRLVRGWFTADEISEALNWPIKSYRIGSWCYFKDTSGRRPFQPFVKRFYNLKHSAPADSVERWVSKNILCSLYGKVRQATRGKAGKLWNPMYAATITGHVRARMAEINRLNGFSALQFATDGVFFDADDLVQIPNRPLPACLNLGQWELENRGEFLCLIPGVYSIRNDEKCKTRFRGSSSVFLRGKNLFDFCEENGEFFSVATTIRRPYSAKEARARSDLSLINVFAPFKCELKVQANTTKRLLRAQPETFDELTSQWWPSFTHLKVD